MAENFNRTIQNFTPAKIDDNRIWSGNLQFALQPFESVPRRVLEKSPYEHIFYSTMKTAFTALLRTNLILQRNSTPSSVNNSSMKKNQFKGFVVGGRVQFKIPLDRNEI